MLKRILIIFVLLFINLGLFLNCYSATPNVNCVGLPGCKIVDNDGIIKGEIGLSNNTGYRWITNVISEGIKYVAVFAVISLIISGFFYILSGGEEAKTKKAKNMIIWSLLGVLISISAWGIINLVNKINLNKSEIKITF